MNRHVWCLSFRSRTKKGLTSWLTHPKARAHSGDQPLRPEAVVPRTVRRATAPVLLCPLRPEAVVPRTDRRATDPSCLLMTLAGYSDRLQLEAKDAHHRASVLF